MWCWAVRDLRHNVVHTCFVGGRCWWQYYRISVGFRILSLYMEDSRDRQYTTCFLPTWYRELMTMWMLYFKWLFFLSKKNAWKISCFTWIRSVVYVKSQMFSFLVAAASWTFTEKLSSLALSLCFSCFYLFHSRGWVCFSTEIAMTMHK